MCLTTMFVSRAYVRDSASIRSFTVVVYFAGWEYRGYEPKWFAKQSDPLTGNLIHMFTHEYWKCKLRRDWSRCPDIFVDWPATTQH